MEVPITLQKSVSKGSDRGKKSLRGCSFGQQANGTDTSKCFRRGSQDHLTAKCLKPPKENKKEKKQVCFIAKGNCACNRGENNTD